MAHAVVWPGVAVAEPDRPQTVYSPAYVDVPPGAPFEAEIRSLHAGGVTRGCTEDGRAYCPDRPVTRGEMAAFLGRVMDLETTGDAEGDPFVDDDGSVFEGDIARLAAAGVTAGCNPPVNDRFCPHRTVTRGEMAAFLVRALAPGEEAAVGFHDDDGSVFEADIARLAAAGVTRGCNPPVNDSFCPDREVTRAEMAAFLSRGFHLPVVPDVPPGAVVDRVKHPGVPVGTMLSVCQVERAAGSLLVRNAAHGSEQSQTAHGYEPSFLRASGGTYDPGRDIWITPEEGGCSSFEIGWDPRTNVLAPPLPALEVTSHFGNRLHPILGVWRLHAGTDFAADPGDTVYAAASGEVTAATTHTAYGRMVDVRHPGGLLTRYAHLSSIGVKVGAMVEPGSPLGQAGCSGSCTGPHLHFETREFGQAVDPLSYLR